MAKTCFCRSEEIVKSKDFQRANESDTRLLWKLQGLLGKQTEIDPGLDLTNTRPVNNSVRILSLLSRPDHRLSLSKTKN